VGGLLPLKTRVQLSLYVVMESESLVKVAMTETRCLGTAALLLALSRPVTLAVADPPQLKIRAFSAPVGTTALEGLQKLLAPTAPTQVLLPQHLPLARLLCVETATGAQMELAQLAFLDHGCLREQERPQHLAHLVLQDPFVTERVSSQHAPLTIGPLLVPLLALRALLVLVPQLAAQAPPRVFQYVEMESE
jgi:hypothetical protein